MWNSFRRIRKKIHSLFTQKIIESNNSSKMNQIIKLGHYQKTTTIDSDNPEIIRVIGESVKNPGYFNTMDNKQIPAYELEEYWTLLDTVASIKDSVKTLPKNIFAGIGEDEEVEDEEPNTNIGITLSDEAMDDFNEKTKSLNPFENVSRTKLPVIKKEVLEHTVIEKLRINKLNNPSNTVKQIIIPVTLNIELDYDITKLSDTIEILGLNKNIVVEYLLNNIKKESFDTAIRNTLNKIISEKSFDTQKTEEPYVSKTNEKNSIAEFNRDKEIEELKGTISELKTKSEDIDKQLKKLKEQPVEVVSTPSSRNVETKLTEGISEIDNFLSKLV